MAQNVQRIAEWKKANTERIVLETRKDERLNERLRAAIDAGVAQSKQGYILAAVNVALARDGFPSPSAEAASADDQLTVRLPKGCRSMIDTYAKLRGETADSIISRLLAAEMGLSGDEWRVASAETKGGQTVDG